MVGASVGLMVDGRNWWVRDVCGHRCVVYFRPQVGPWVAWLEVRFSEQIGRVGDDGEVRPVWGLWTLRPFADKEAVVVLSGVVRSLEDQLVLRGCGRGSHTVLLSGGRYLDTSRSRFRGQYINTAGGIAGLHHNARMRGESWHYPEDVIVEAVGAVGAGVELLMKYGGSYLDALHVEEFARGVRVYGVPGRVSRKRSSRLGDYVW